MLCVSNTANLFFNKCVLQFLFLLASCLSSVTSRPFITCSLLLSSSSSLAHWQWTTLTRAGVFARHIQYSISLFQNRFVSRTLTLIWFTLIAFDSFFPYFRLVLDFDLFFYAFGKPGTVIWAWLIMFTYTLLGPYYILSRWREWHHRYQWKMLVSAAAAMALLAAQMSLLGYFPVYVVVQYQLPPASRFIIILEQVLWEYNRNLLQFVCFVLFCASKLRTLCKTYIKIECNGLENLLQWPWKCRST